MSTDGRETNDLGRTGRSERSTHRGDDGLGLREPGARIEVRRRQDEDTRGVRESTGERLGILHFGNRDFTAEIGPEPALVRIADDRADSLALGQQGARDGAADLARDTGDCKHEYFPFRRGPLE